MATHFPALPFAAPPPTLVLTPLAAGGSVPADSDSHGFSPLG